jgi:hypothetical protein
VNRRDLLAGMSVPFAALGTRARRGGGSVLAAPELRNNGAGLRVSL